MAESPNLDATLDLSLVERANRLVKQCAAAGREALRGSPPPRIDTYLVHVAEADKASLEVRLRNVAREYEQRLIAERSRPADEVATIPESEGAARIEPAVVRVAGKHATADLGATVALEGSTPRAEDKTAVIDQQKPTCMDKTVDAAEGKVYAAGANFDVGPLA